MLEKRGISAVVATILIILIVIAAIALLWLGIIPLIKKNIGFDAEADLNVEQSEGYTFYDKNVGVDTDGDGVADDQKKIGFIQIKRGPDRFGEVELDYLMIYVSVGGQTTTFATPKAPSENNAETYELDLDGFTDEQLNNLIIRIAAVIDGVVGNSQGGSKLEEGDFVMQGGVPLALGNIIAPGQAGGGGPGGPPEVPIPCQLLAVSWQDNTVFEDDGVGITVTAQGNCGGKTVNFIVFEDDVIGDDSVTTWPVSVGFGEGENVVGSEWKAEWQEDGVGGIANPPEYYVIGKLASGDDTMIESGLVEVYKRPKNTGYGYGCDISKNCIENVGEDPTIAAKPCNPINRNRDCINPA